MKIKYFQLVLLSSLLITTSCSSLINNTFSPKINYLGSQYAPKKQIEVFFDEKDISYAYKVMGIIKSESSLIMRGDLVAEIKKKMIEKSKHIGADAILFKQFYKETRIYEKSIVFDDEEKIEYRTYTIVEAKLIKYKEKRN